VVRRWLARAGLLSVGIGLLMGFVRPWRGGWLHVV